MKVGVDVVVERGTCIALFQREELVGISHTIGQVYIVWLVSVYSVVPGANLEGLCVVLLL